MATGLSRRMPPSGPWRWQGPGFEQSISSYDHVAITTTHKRDNIFSLGARSEADHAELNKRKDGRHLDRIRSEGWLFPPAFVSKQLQASPKQLLVVEAEGDSMAPTIMSGEKVIVDTGHKTPSPDGLYAIRDPFNNVIVRRLQLLRAAQPSRVKIISDNPKHAAEEVALKDLEVVGKALRVLKQL
jgi:hypothetical protein